MRPPYSTLTPVHIYDYAASGIKQHPIVSRLVTPRPLDTALLFCAVPRMGMVVSFVVQTSNFFRGKIYPQHFQVASASREFLS
jgi:hypothetical protein